MTIKDFLSADISDLLKMSDKELRTIAAAGAKASNRRIQAFEIKGIKGSPAVADLPRAYKKGFSTKGKTRRQLYNIVRAERQFLTNPTSTITGHQAVTQIATDTIDPATTAQKSGLRVFKKSTGEETESKLLRKNVSEKQVSKYWDIFNRYREKHGLTKEQMYKVAETFMDDFFESADLRYSAIKTDKKGRVTEGRMYKDFEDYMTKAYEDAQSVEDDENELTKVVTIGGISYKRR